MMELIRVTAENIDREHICCALSGSKDPSVAAKKAWLTQRFADGLVFLKGNVRGKCFVEYLPAQAAWAPVEAPGCLFLNCLWVSGQHKGQGNARRLLEACIQDGQAQGKAGLCAISSSPKQPFLSDPKFLARWGFVEVDQAPPYFSLWYLPLRAGQAPPRFLPQVKDPKIRRQGFVVYYTHQCPFPAKYVPLLAQRAAELGLPFQSRLLDSREAARQAPVVLTNFALFYNGRFVTHEILSVKKFDALAARLEGRDP